MQRRRTHYTAQGRQQFYAALTAYKQALESGDPRAIILTSLRIHAAKGEVPQRLRSLVGRTFRETYRTTPLRAKPATDEREEQQIMTTTATKPEKCSSFMPNKRGEETMVLCAKPIGHTDEHVNRSKHYRWANSGPAAVSNTTAGGGLECPECGAVTLQPCAHPTPAGNRSDSAAATARPPLEWVSTLEGTEFANIAGMLIRRDHPLRADKITVYAIAVTQETGEEMCRAVNSFEAMRDALQLAKADLYEGCFADSTAAAIDAALAVAEGKGGR